MLPGKLGLILSRHPLPNPSLKLSLRGKEWPIERINVSKGSGGRKIGGMRIGWRRMTSWEEIRVKNRI
jgi:hypothetical protein